MKVAIIMGSTSDLPKVEPAISILKNYGVEVNVRCLSAHRAHLGLSSFIKETETDGTEVIITAAGMAAAHDCRMTEEVISFGKRRYDRSGRYRYRGVAKCYVPGGAGQRPQGVGPHLGQAQDELHQNPAR